MLPITRTLISTIDPSLGKIDKSTLSQQTLMELFIEGIDNKHIICGSSENPNDISEWTNIAFNDNMDITEIYWNLSDVNGSIALEWVPLAVEKLVITSHFPSDGWLMGTIDLTALPDALKHLDLSGNDLTGTISLTSLPSKMTILDLNGNDLSGSLDLTHLPATLENLDLSWNNFEGLTDFSKLPESLREFGLINTRLEGTLCVDTERMQCKIEDTAIVLKRKT